MIMKGKSTDPWCEKKNSQYKTKLLNNLIDIEKSNPNEFWNISDRFKHNGGGPTEKSCNISSEEWRSYFTNLLNCMKIIMSLQMTYNLIIVLKLFILQTIVFHSVSCKNLEMP